MQYVLIISGIVLVVYLAFAFYGSQKVSAIGTVTVGGGKVECKLQYANAQKKPLYAMALCYAVKIKWLLQTEGDGAEKTFTNIFGNTLQEWPQVPYVEMLSSIRNEESVFRVKVYSGKRWYVNNTFPAKYYGGDIATHYFFLLKEIVKELNDEEKQILGKLLKEAEGQIIALKGRSVNDLHDANKRMDFILSKIN